MSLSYISKGGVIRHVSEGSKLHEILEKDPSWKLTGEHTEATVTRENINAAIAPTETQEDATDALEGLSNAELKELAKSMGIKGYSKMSGNQLRRAIKEAE